MSETLVVGIDAGGTGTRCVVATTRGFGVDRVIGRGEAAGANPTSARVPHVALTTALRSALADTDPQLVGHGVVGMAGSSLAGHSTLRILRRAWHSAGLTCPVELRSDLEIAFASSTINTSGLLLVAGTGAAAAAVRDLRVVRRCDGHGWLLGDDGSAVWLGRQAVRAVLAALDGRAEPTSLTSMVAAALGLAADADPRQALIAAVHSGPVPALARLGPVVSAAAAAGDAIARAIAAEATERLLDTLDAVARDDHAPSTVALAGSVLLAAGPVGDAVRQGVRARYGVEPAAATDPAIAAARLAAGGLAMSRH